MLLRLSLTHPVAQREAPLYSQEVMVALHLLLTLQFFHFTCSCSLFWPVLTLYNVCSVPWGSSVLWGYHDACGGYLEYRGGYYDKCGGTSCVPWGVILSTVEDTHYRVRYRDAPGGIS